ncbi:Sip1/TFIP11 interacting protein [Phlegmacium glaucopus]|nr:Sip1/TFIP11 interacting protein [Phlegmacium glaucopus]
MGRRKRVLDDGDDSDSPGSADGLDFDLENDPDAREERALFENPYQNKRRRTNGKEDALYGIFAESSEDEGTGGRTSRVRSKRSDWTKAPTFTAGDRPVKLDDPMAVDQDQEKNDISREDSEGQNGDEDDGSEAEDEDDGSEAEDADDGSEAENDAEEVEFAGPLRGGIGSKPSLSSIKHSEDTFPPAPSDPDATTRPAFNNRGLSFTRESNSSPRPVPLPASELAHFSKIQSSFGARMLAKMGWQAGTGLGVAGEGIVTPIESKLRPQKMGIAFKGFKEKTEQSKMEAKRRGEAVSGDEDEKTKKFRRKAKEQAEKRSDVWKRPKKSKIKIEHKTYEQIIAEAEEVAAPGIGQIIDATGAVPREVTSLADISLNAWSPSNDPTRIPEVRHNVRLIADACKSDLDGLAREAKALQERNKFATGEDFRLRKKVDDEAQLIARLQQVQLLADDINVIAKELTSVYEVSLEPFSPHFQKLISEYSYEYDKYRLDEIVVAAIAPIVRRMVANWNPLEQPSLFLLTFQSWRRALKINDAEIPSQTQVDVYGARNIAAPTIAMEKPMTPFESLLWNIWLPKVRTSINNEWSPDLPQRAVKLYEVWSSFLPPFIRDNLLDQLILPKVQKAVADWDSKNANASLQAIVFPWLPYIGLRLEDIVGDARRKIKNLLRVEEDMPTDLVAWRDVFDAKEWDAMILKYVVPRLGASLRNDFRVNPRDQKMEPLQRVFAWSNIIRPSIFSQILETEFFPKWLDILHIWLIQPRVSFGEVADWYEFWKKSFPESIRNLPGINRGFTRGLQLMDKAYELGPDAPTQLAKPDFLREITAASSPKRGTKASTKPRPSARTHEITFRSIVEEYAATHNLLFIPTGRAHERSRMPLFRVSRTAEGRRGLLVYILDDAVWAPETDSLGLEGEEFKAISLEDMVERAA